VRDRPILVGEDRAPVWPPGIVGSISHCRGLCAVAVARSSRIASVGLDVETGEPLSGDLLPLVVTASESTQLGMLPQRDGLDWPKLLFSAKEALYKCYYPLARSFLDFQDVEVLFATDRDAFSARIVRPDAPSCAGYRELRGRFLVESNHVFTGVAVGAANAP
jgi:4'-phosphopantetheinyl transferase EntD